MKEKKRYDGKWVDKKNWILGGEQFASVTVFFEESTKRKLNKIGNIYFWQIHVQEYNCTRLENLSFKFSYKCFIFIYYTENSRHFFLVFFLIILITFLYCVGFVIQHQCSSNLSVYVDNYAKSFCRSDYSYKFLVQTRNRFNFFGKNYQHFIRVTMMSVWRPE